MGALQLLQSVTGQAPSADTTIVTCGVTKMFVGELIEAGARSCHPGTMPMTKIARHLLARRWALC